MTRAPKPPRVVWVMVDGVDRSTWMFSSERKARRDADASLGDSVHRYILADAPTPRRKRGKR